MKVDEAGATEIGRLGNALECGTLAGGSEWRMVENGVSTQHEELPGFVQGQWLL